MALPTMNGDGGTPVALEPGSITGQAFLQLAARVVTETDRRNIEREKTKIVEMKK